MAITEFARPAKLMSIKKQMKGECLNIQHSKVGREVGAGGTANANQFT